MLDLAVIVLRWLQYSGAVVLLGAPLFLLLSFRPGDDPGLRWGRPLLIVAALVVAVASLVGLVAQTAIMAGSLSEAIKPESLQFMVSGTALGKALVVRAAAAVMALGLIALLKPGRLMWTLATLAGLVVAGSLAWTGHAGATEGPGGPVHIAADIVHAVAAALWLGSLVAFTKLLARPAESDNPAIYRALHGFSGIGTLAVALLVLTGLVNSWFLVGPSKVWDLGSSPYGQLLIVKLVLFALMLVLAAVNRFRLTPQLGTALDNAEDPQPALEDLRRSVKIEALVGAALLAVVAVLGTLAPPSAL